MRGYEKKSTRLACREWRMVVDLPRRIVWINLNAREGANLIAIIYTL